MNPLSILRSLAVLVGIIKEAKEIADATVQPERDPDKRKAALRRAKERADDR